MLLQFILKSFSSWNSNCHSNTSNVRIQSKQGGILPWTRWRFLCYNIL